MPYFVSRCVCIYEKIFNIFVKKNHLPSSVALHFLFGLDPSFYGVLHFLDGQGFPTVAFVEIGQ
ncbi:hypothetical protein MtrunA17_Chr2g0279851 [Medicago truncatula]|uniref:Uncharacterized protein n=1 Tax=Medicago truncatula TaxID=3880 RepID=A0A396J4S7_MEDTR|nr:hypothetical protein MtrunA17_Chr2g0279851 [Medicago truncatula]